MIKTEENLYGQFHMCMKLMHKCQRGGHGHRGQGKLLGLLLKQDGLSHKEIVQALDVRPSTESELVAKLEQAGYVYKMVSEADKRVTHVYLTDEGRAVAEENAAKRIEAGRDLFKGLADEEQAQLSVLMEKLTASLMEQVSQMPEETSERGQNRQGHRGGKHKGHHGEEHESERGHREHGGKRKGHHRGQDGDEGERRGSKHKGRHGKNRDVETLKSQSENGQQVELITAQD